MPDLKRFSKLKWPLAALGLTVLWFTIHCIVTSIDGLTDTDSVSAPADAAVVLGNQVFENRTPGDLLLERLEKALEIYRKGAATHIICSGGKGPKEIFEADVMRDWLVAQGVDPAVIVVDHDGKDSYNTALDTKKIFEERGWHSALIVSHFTHISRCKLAFRRFGITDLRSAHAKFAWIDLKELPREFAGFYYYLVRSY